MSYWKLKLMKKSIINKILFIFILFINFEVLSKDFIIEGNQFTDDDIVISIIEVIPDGSRKFTDGMNMLVDKDNLGFGPRSWRYACVIDNGEITDWFIEEGKEDNCEEDPYHYTSPEFILASL